MTSRPRPGGFTRRQAGAALVLAAALLAIYLPGIGAGFIRDDFAWIRASAIGGPADVLRFFERSTGFYRPLVAVSFGLNRALGFDPLWYGLVNLALLLTCTALLVALFMRLGLDPGGALLGAGIWALNFHGINMAVLWISGRTALLLILFSLLAARAAVRDRWWTAAGWTLLALLSKEEAVMLPAMLIAWRFLLSPRPVAAGRVVLTMALPLGVYFALRAHSGAMTPLDAPAEYRFTSDVWAILRNGREYADRAATLPGLVTLAAIALAWTRRRSGRAPISLGPDDRRLMVMGGVWLAGGYAVTLWVPVRSSLYACFPSIGAALAAAVMCRAAFAAMSERRRRVAAIGVLILPFLLWPVYRARNDSYDAAGALSRSVLRELEALPIPAGRDVIVTDEDARPNLLSTFGGLLPDALELYQIPFRVCVEPYENCAPPETSNGAPPVRLVLDRGHLQRQ